MYIPAECEVRLETEFTGVRGQDLTVVQSIPRDQSSIEHRLDKELSIKVGRCRIKRRAGNAL